MIVLMNSPEYAVDQFQLKSVLLTVSISSTSIVMSPSLPRLMKRSAERLDYGDMSSSGGKHDPRRHRAPPSPRIVAVTRQGWSDGVSRDGRGSRGETTVKPR
ncbi:hypothetical protein [Thermostaphylospora chromogena]|uniref:hypothetical protein n=1 Tax=Thermostaphylospora chromogena TaxID=35622 RepID=UPI001041CBD1|nr:hypothetical protein [Thermostaphylospora chromogena]